MDLRHIVKNMHNRSEANRVKKEKDLKEEMEAAEAQRAKAEAAASLQDRERHNAADRIISLFHRMKARQHGLDKALTREMQLLLAQQALLTNSATAIQKRFRLYSTRLWISAFYPSATNAAAKSRSSRAPQRLPRGIDFTSRVQYELQQRRLMERVGLMASMKDKYVSLCASHARSVQYWREQYAAIPLCIAVLEQRKAALDEQSKAVAETRPRKALIHTGSAESASLEVIRGKALRITAGHLDRLVENARMQMAWIQQCLRMTCRRLSVLKERYRYDRCPTVLCTPSLLTLLCAIV